MTTATERAERSARRAAVLDALRGGPLKVAQIAERVQAALPGTTPQQVTGTITVLHHDRCVEVVDARRDSPYKDKQQIWALSRELSSEPITGRYPGTPTPERVAEIAERWQADGRVTVRRMGMF